MTHVHSMIRLVFSDEKSLVSSRAYTILSLGDNSLIEEMLRDYKFRDFALEILSNPQNPPFIMGRLAGLSLSALLSMPETASESCGFIYHLLKHCENPSVFNFFETLCGDNPKATPSQKWLLDMGFVEYIIREIQTTNFNYVSNLSNTYLDPVYDKALCLYELIALCAKNPILSPSFKTSSIVDVIKRDFSRSPDFLKTARWAAINSITCKDTAVQLLPLIQSAISTVTEQFEHLKSYRVDALNFLTQMIQLAPMTADILLHSSVLQSLSGLIIQFPNSTILHGAFVDFVSIGLQLEEFAIKMVGVYTPLFIDQACERYNRVLAPTLLYLIEKFMEASDKKSSIRRVLTEIPELKQFINHDLKEYKKIIDSDYGGPRATGIFGALKGFFD